jgi:ketosteroid isomerase-like protein
MMRSNNRTRSGSLLLRIAAAAAAMAFVAGAAPRASAQADQALKLQRQFQDACVSGDIASVAPLMADDAIFIHGNGAAQSKTEFLAAIKNGQLSLSAYNLKDPKVLPFDGGAIVSGLVDLTFKPRPNATAQPLTLHMRGSSVWLHTRAGWRLILDQDTTLAGPPARPPQ